MKDKKHKADDTLGKAIGSRLKSAFDTLGLTITQASERLGYPQSTISRYIAGYNLPQVDLLVALYERLKINPLYILFGIEPIIVEKLQSPSKRLDEDFSITPFVASFLSFMANSLGILGNIELLKHSELNISLKEFEKLLSKEYPVNMEILNTISCSFCASIESILEDASYHPNIIEVGVFDWDGKLEKIKNICSIEKDIIIIDTSNETHFYIWCKHGEYGGFILKVNFSYDDLRNLYEFLSKNLRVYIGGDISKDLEIKHPYIVLTSTKNYFYGFLSKSTQKLKALYPHHPAISVLEGFLSLPIDKSFSVV